MTKPNEFKSTPILYSKASEAEVSTFKSLPKERRAGSYWDESHKGLTTLKTEVKQYYLHQQNYTCAYCRQEIVVTHGGAWDTDHIIPKDSHPEFMFEPQNLCVSCKDCNNLKRAKNVLRDKRRVTFPRTAKDYIFCHPHFHDYAKHIRVVRVAGLYLPRTSEGIKTIEICGLMRFVLNFANYDCPDTETALKIQELSSELVAAQHTTEYVAILNIIKTLVDDGLLKAARAALSARYA
ncbi:HNH endonuclease [Pseudomonas atacamensis]|uniref:HNH endonuclease n=1 Tax=Pseudomonas atacamensis TaxID=2565368 RepID=UPI001C3D7CD5|nr:HNH endonuclease [Pseudomonas atacamensis]QXH73824.1 HNH endonuclease [Pseudomonas atacamensis]